MLGIHISKRTAKGWFGQGKRSAILSIVIITALLISIITLGIFLAVSAGRETPTPVAPTQGPVTSEPATITPAIETPTPETLPGVIEITAKKLLTELLADPEKYKEGTVFQVSGTFVWNLKYSASTYTDFFLGPAVYNDDIRLAVRICVFYKEKEAFETFNSINTGDQIVVRGTYVFFSAQYGISLENCSLISITPAK